MLNRNVREGWRAKKKKLADTSPKTPPQRLVKPWGGGGELEEGIGRGRVGGEERRPPKES